MKQLRFFISTLLLVLCFSLYSSLAYGVTCPICGSTDATVQADNNCHWYTCPDQNNLKIDEAHKWVVTPATCTANGSRTCSVCSKTETIQALGHAMGSWSVTTPATCTQNGTMTRTCTRTGCTQSETKPIIASGHNFGQWSITTPATCTSDGVMTRTCNNTGCTYSETKAITKLGHNYSTSKITTAATCTTNGVRTYYCENNNVHTTTEVISMLGHDFSTSWTSNSTQHWHKCQRSGCTVTTTKTNHADTSQDGKCDTCGYQMITLLEKPSIGQTSFIYSGTSQAPTLVNYDSTKMTVVGNSGIDANTYTAKFSLNNTTTTKWKDYSTADVTYTWKINQYPVNITWEEPTTFEYDAASHIPVAKAKGVEGETLNLVVNSPQTNVGSYVATATLSSVTGGQAKPANYSISNNTHEFFIKDNSLPTLTVAQNISSWTNQNVIFTLTTTDSGTGINKLEYSLDGVTWRNDFDTGSTVTSATKTFSVAQNSLVYFRALDNAENASEIKGPYNVRIDKTAPSLNCTHDSNEGWVNDKVVIHIEATDDLSLDSIMVNDTAISNNISDIGSENGIVKNKKVDYDATSNGTYVIKAKDLAGNEVSKSITISNIDKTKPTITIPTTINTNEQTIVLKDDTAPNSKMRYVAVSKNSSDEPKAFGTTEVTQGNELDFYYQVPNNETVNFTFSFSESGTYYIFARDLAGNFLMKSTTLSYRDLSDSGFSLVVSPNSFVYDGNLKTPDCTVTDTTNGNKVLQKDIDYTVSIENNLNAGTGTYKITGIGNYKGSTSAPFEISKRTITILPDQNQTKYLHIDNQNITYTYSNEVIGEIPAFSGALSRAGGEEAGTYVISLGTLALEDNDNFLKNNYTIELSSTPVTFSVIEMITPLTFTWNIPAKGTATLPVPSYGTNNYLVSWGDGDYDEITMQGFPTHTYTNESAQDFTVRVMGKVRVFGYIDDIKPTADNIYSPYVSFNNYLKKIISFGDIQAERLGFAYCEKLTGPIPQRSGFDNLTSTANMFNNCKELSGTIPSGFFANLPKLNSVENTFKACSKLTGSLDSSIFENSVNIINFQYVFYGCTLINGTIPENLFATNTKAQLFAGALGEMPNITGEIPVGVFANNVLATSFSRAFLGDTKITSIPEDLFRNNTLAINYSRTFQGCTGLTEVPTNLFSNNTIKRISDLVEIDDDYYATFYRCSNLTTINLNMKYVGNSMFKDCANLKKAVLPDVIIIGNKAFEGCNALDTVIVSKETLASVGNDTFKYTGANSPKLTYINKENEILLNYAWEPNSRSLDLTAPVGTVKIITPKYPFTNTESVSLQITLTDDNSAPEQCEVAILNDSSIRDYKPEEIMKYINWYSTTDTEIEGILNSFEWQNYEADKTWTLLAGEGTKTVYVYFRDAMGNISFVTQNLEIYN